ncbi:hypothetical protein C8R47DRAFT_539712 [Mycena vitilis]|nr:hypothetical protein C8R47DRAFT_539712 [Mycena vitilis]
MGRPWRGGERILVEVSAGPPLNAAVIFGGNRTVACFYLPCAMTFIKVTPWGSIDQYSGRSAGAHLCDDIIRGMVFEGTVLESMDLFRMDMTLGGRDKVILHNCYDLDPVPRSIPDGREAFDTLPTLPMEFAHRINRARGFRGPEASNSTQRGHRPDELAYRPHHAQQSVTPARTSFPPPPPRAGNNTQYEDNRYQEPARRPQHIPQSVTPSRASFLPPSARAGQSTQRGSSQRESEVARPQQAQQAATPTRANFPPAPTARTQNERQFECAVCLETHSEQDAARVEPCQHTFCRDCMTGHVRARIGERQYPIRCPNCAAGGPGSAAVGVIDERVLNTLGLSRAERQTFDEMSIAQFADRIECPGCHRRGPVERDPSQRTILCPFGCNTQWCRECNTVITGYEQVRHTCDGQAEMEHLAQRAGWKRCPQCNILIERSGGCNHMTCTRCHSHFCYRDGMMLAPANLAADRRSQAIHRHYNGVCAGGMMDN